MKKTIAIFIFTITVIYSCIPIIDEIPPQNPKLDTDLLKSNYYYGDTLSLIITHTDESALDTGRLMISRVSAGTGELPSWGIDSLLVRNNGRSFVDTIVIKIPSFIDWGDYQVEIFTIDQGGNQSALDTTIFFNLYTDITPPAFHKLDTLGKDLELVYNEETDEYLACRASLINVNTAAYITDNLNLDFIGFKLGSGAENLKRIATGGLDSVNISENIKDQIIIPSDIENGTILTFTLIAVDTFKLRTEKIFKIKVDCDDQPPLIDVTATIPVTELHQNNRDSIEIVQGGSLKLTAVTITDNKFIKDVKVYFNEEGAALELFNEVSINLSRPIQLEEFMELDFPISLATPPGKKFIVSILATDAEGLASVPYMIQMTAREDENPDIFVTNLSINNTAVTLGTENIYTLAQDGSATYAITFEGKVEDDATLQTLVINWGFQGNTSAVINLDNPALPLQLSTIHDNTNFIIPQSAIGTVYELELIATDSKGQVTNEKIFFKILE